MSDKDMNKLLDAGFILVSCGWNNGYPAMKVKLPEIRTWTALKESEPFQDYNELQKALDEILKDPKTILI